MLKIQNIFIVSLYVLNTYSNFLNTYLLLFFYHVSECKVLTILLIMSGQGYGHIAVPKAVCLEAVEEVVAVVVEEEEVAIHHGS